MKANGMQKKKMTGNGFLLLITIALFVVMYIAGMIIFADKGFAKPQMFLNLFVSNAGLLVIACGLTIVMITGGIDISVGSVTALVCMVLADLMENKGVNTYVAVLVALLIGVAFGVVQGFLVAYLDIQPFIVTLAGMFFGRGMTAIISTDMISIKNELFLKWANFRFYMPFGSTNKKGKFIPAYIPPTVVIAVIVVIIIAVLLKYRKFGRKLYAIGGNRQSALMMGLNVKRTMFSGYWWYASFWWCWYTDWYFVWCSDQGYHFQFDYYPGYVIKLVGKNYSFTVAVFLYCDSVSDCFYDEESEISDCIMKQAGTWMGSGLFLFLQRGCCFVLGTGNDLE